jgi:transposase-like protein
MRYQDGFKKSIVRKLLIPETPGITRISEETGVAIPTLYNWLKKYKDNVELADYKKTPEEWTLSEKSEALMGVINLSPEEQGEWLRHNGLQSSHLKLWRKDVQKALSDISKPNSSLELRSIKKENKELKKEVNKKDKALAEVTALLVLKKKLEHLFWEEDQ